MEAKLLQRIRTNSNNLRNISPKDITLKMCLLATSKYNAGMLRFVPDEFKN